MPNDTQRTTTIDPAQLDLPERVTVAVAQLASASCKRLLTLGGGDRPAGALGHARGGRRRLSDPKAATLHKLR